METVSWRKVLQKQIYDIISHRYGLLVIIIGAILIVVSAFHFGESVVEWSTEKYAAVFNSFSDNLAGRSYRERLCLPVPIDVVYTWVNGTDPDLIRNLQKLKMEMKDELNTSSQAQCVFSNCVPSNTVVLYPALPGNWSLAQLVAADAAFQQAKTLYKVSSPIDYKNYTAVVFTEEKSITDVINKTVHIKGQNVTVIRCYITSDSKIDNGIQLQDQIIMSGFPHTLSPEELKLKLPENLQKGVEKIEVDSARGIAVLHVPVREDFDNMLTVSNFSIDGKEPTWSAANLVWDLRDFSRDEDISASRFEDNEELRYSLRSLERFAPWVRHIYIVTNGQLPYWLNLENPRVTIVTHDQIFMNKSHLPSFGSPAIESNLHRIPGLSDKFIYMNDDVMFGKDVWPDDFFTHSSGQKVYLTWPVPNCNEGCPSSWIKDGYCDKACNVSECEWDAGDCDGTNAQAHQIGGWAGQWGSDTQGYCHSGCANNWIADRYCDTACNVLECGFDAGDCGLDKYSQLHGLPLMEDKTQYVLPEGLSYGFFNLTTILVSQNFSLKEASYDDNKVVRTIAFSRKYNVLTVVLYSNFNQTNINFTLVYGTENVTKELNFTLSVNTVPLKEVIPPIIVAKEKLEVANVTVATNTSKPNVTKEEIVFKIIPSELEKPILVEPSPTSDMSHLLASMPSNWSSVPLPIHLQKLYSALQEELKQDELTETGYMLRLKSLWLSYQQYLHSNQSGGQGSKHHPIVGIRNQQPSAIKAQEKEAGVQNEAEKVKQGQRRRLLNVVEEFENLDGEKLNTFVSNVDIQPEVGKLLPWEREGVMDVVKIKEKEKSQSLYDTDAPRGRHLLDTFGDSLRHVNTLFNKAFGYTARKVPGHMPHMIDKNIMTELQDRFPAEWEATSSHQVRHSKDMQYAFAYFYYLMGVKEVTTSADVFDTMDTDKSKVLSDREIRTLATRLYTLPLDLATLTKLENMFVNCSKALPASLQYQADMTGPETYYEQSMPQVTRNLFINCNEIAAIVKSNFPPRSKYKHMVVDDAEIAFKMIKTNVSTVVGQLDDVRKNPKKFICLNDNIDHSQDQARTVKAILQDFYESILPIQSQFELPREYRNRFTHIDELREWRRYRDWLKFWTHIALVLLVVFTVASYFADKIEAAQKRFNRRRTRDTDTGEPPQSSALETV